MTFDLSFVALLLIVVTAFTVEAATGFGAMMIGLGLGAFFFPIRLLLPILVVLDTVLCAYLAWRNRAAVDLPWLLWRIVPLMTVGLGIGLVIGLRAPESLLRRLLGMLVLVVAARDMTAQLRSPTSTRPLSAPVRALALIGAGVMHGVLTTGGPLLVYVLGHSALSKAAFRSTLVVVWVLLDVLLLATYTAAGRIDGSAIAHAIALLPALVVAIVLGEWAHRGLDEGRFRLLVTCVLVVVGISLVL